VTVFALICIKYREQRKDESENIYRDIRKKEVLALPGDIAPSSSTPDV